MAKPTKKKTKRNTRKSLQNKGKRARASARASAIEPAEDYGYIGWDTFTHTDHALLRQLEKNPDVMQACSALGVSRGQFYVRCRENPQLAEARERARAIAWQKAEARAFELGIEGRKQLVLHNGQPIMLMYDEHGNELPEPRPLVRTEYNADLLKKILSAKSPDFADRTMLTGPGGGPFQSEVKYVDRDYLRQLPDDALEKIVRDEEGR